MKKRLIAGIAMLLALALVSACSGQAGDPKQSSTTPSTQPVQQQPQSPPQEKVPTIAELVAKQDSAAAQMVDTSRFKKNGPYKIGVAAGYLSNSWVVFNLQEVKYEASKSKDIAEVVVTDANFKADKHVADIESLIAQGVDAIIYWPVDEKAIAAALKKATDKGIPTIQAGGGFLDSPDITHSVFIDQVRLGEKVARELAREMGGKGDIVAMLPIAGTEAAVSQLAALKAVMAENPGMKLLSAEYGDWNRAKAKSITENLLQKYPKIDGVFSPAGQMSIGVAEAFEEAGRANGVVFSPGDDYNGWLKWVQKNKKAGVVTFPRAGQAAVVQTLKILKGESVPKGLRLDPEYWSPAEIAGGKGVEPNRPDDWWPSNLPPEFLPKQ